MFRCQVEPMIFYDLLAFYWQVQPFKDLKPVEGSIAFLIMSDYEFFY